MHASAPLLFVPETAPFTPEQRAWLNGFLAGVLARGGTANTAAAAEAPRPKLTILFGTQTGTAEKLAKRAAKIAAQRGFAPETVDMGATDPAKLATCERLLVLTSTYGDGEPPDNARALFDALRAGTPSLAAVEFTVCGLGDTNYARFCQAGKDFAALLEKHGAKAVAPRVDCDLDYEAPFAAWLETSLAAWATVAATGAPASTPPALAEPSSPTAPTHDRDHPFAARLIEARVLNTDGGDKEVRHLAFSLAGSGLSYAPGDAIGIYPHNCPELVAEILQAIGCDGEEAVQLKSGLTVPLRRALTEHCDLGKPTAELAARLAGPAPLPSAHAPLHVIDLLRLRPESRLPAAELVRLLRPLAPRLYSISSSPAAHPDEVHATVGVVRYEAHGRARKGVCSTFLAHRTVPGQTAVRLYVHANTAFKLPDDSSRAVILIGPGTGIAPFRGFLHHRRATGAAGRNWLFFGDRHAASDFLYRDEIASFQRDGLLTRIDTAFSRDQAEKRYVQHRMLEQAADLYSWLEDGAHIYVCGDAARMAKDVDDALRQVIVRAGNKTEAAAAQYVQNLRAARRYARDVY